MLPTHVVLASCIGLALQPSSVANHAQVARDDPDIDMVDVLGVDPSDQSTGELGQLSGLLGGAQWPKKGQEHRPSSSLTPLQSGMTWQLFRGVTAASLAIMIFIGCRVYYSQREQQIGFEEDVNEAQQPLLPPTMAQQSSSLSHFRALCCAIYWRHLQRRAILTHLLRLAVPVVLLLLMNTLRDFMASKLQQGDGNMDKAQMAQASDGILELAMSVGVIYMVMISMMFFVWHVSGESESGLRHLLHVSGVSRPAYMVATAGVDGFGVVMIELLFMLLVCATWFQVRVVLWTAPQLLLLMISIMVVSSLVTGYLVHFLTPSAKMASMVAQLVVAVITIQAPLSPMRPVVPGVGEQSWSALAFPVIPAYRGFFELSFACVKGRCLTLGDVCDALHNGEYAGIWTMVVGIDKEPELTPPGAFLSFLMLALCQVALGCAVIVMLDMRCYPSLHASGVQSQRKTSDEAMLEVKGLTHQYGWFRGMIPSETNRTLNGISFAVPPGAVLGLLGPNGAGKTTCIRCITGEEAPTVGSIAMNAAAHSAYIGLCPQETVLNQCLTVRQNLLFFAYVRGCTGFGAERILEHFLAASRLTDKRDCLPDTLSGGMKRRLAVACSLIGAPAVAVLDEPTTGLDPSSRRGIWSTVNDIKMAGSCCLLTTHMLEEAESLCSKLVVIKRGVVAASGSVQQLKEEWGTGYMLNIDSKPGQQDLARKFIASRVPKESAEPIKAVANGQMTFKLKVEEEALGHLIIAIAQGKELSGIRHWGMSQASLEDTYLRIIEQESEEHAATTSNL